MTEIYTLNEKRADDLSTAELSAMINMKYS